MRKAAESSSAIARAAVDQASSRAGSVVGLPVGSGSGAEVDDGGQPVASSEAEGAGALSEGEAAPPAAVAEAAAVAAVAEPAVAESLSPQAARSPAASRSAAGAARNIKIS